MRYLVLSLLAISTSLISADEPQSPERNWHQWRGPHATGVAPHGDPPIQWSEEQNIRWKVAIDGHGKSTPIIWGNKVFLLTAIDTGKADPKLPAPNEQPKRPFGIIYPNTIHQYVILCLDRDTGTEIWRRVAAERIHNEGHHGDNSFATASPTTDGQRLYAWFGYAGLFCYDLDGELLWQRDFGEVKTRLSFGEGSSPVVCGDRVILVRDQENQSIIMALNTTTGETVWEQDRDEPSAWATPIVVTHQGKTQIITNGKTRVRSYALSDGDLIWECGGQVSNVIPSPVASGSFVICMSGYRGSALYALPLDAAGDITDSEKILWSDNKGTPYVPSPLLYDGWLYFNQSNDAILSCLNAESGATIIPRTRLDAIRRLYASPVGAAGRIYVAGRAGATLVIERTSELKVLATNVLNDSVDASPAIVGKQLFLRGESHLYCIAEE